MSGASLRARLALSDRTDWLDLDEAAFVAANQRASDKGASLAARLVTGRARTGSTLELTAVDLGDRTLGLRVHRPRNAAGLLPLVMSFHGGGFVAGAPAQNDWLNSYLAVTCRAVVVSVDYRLAPAAPLPAALDDGRDVLAELVGRAEEFGVDPASVALFGESAGGTIAATAARRAADQGVVLAGLALAYPVVDWSPGMDDPARYPSVVNETHPGLSLARLQAARRWSVPAGLDPLIPSPALCRGHGQLPPTLIQVGTADLLRDHGLHYAQVLRADGVSTKVAVYPRATHAFFCMPGLNSSARRARKDLAGFLRDRMRPDVSEQGRPVSA